MKITSFTKYYRIEKCRKTFVQTGMQMGKTSVKRTLQGFKEVREEVLYIYIHALLYRII
jgi:hypothetical protein